MDQNNKVRGPIVVYTAANVTEAGLLKSELDAAGFMCEMLNVHHAALISVAPVIGVRLIVPAKQAKAALEFIKSRDK